MASGGEHLAFVLGHYKSGSTWLTQLLSLHPDVRSLRETHLFHHAGVAADARGATELLFRDTPWAAGNRRRLLLRRMATRVGLASPPLVSEADRPVGRRDLPLRSRRALRRLLMAQRSSEDCIRAFFGWYEEELGPSRYLLEKSPTNILHVAEIGRLYPRAKLLAIVRDGRDVVVSDRAFVEQYKGQTGWNFSSSVERWRDLMHAHKAALERHRMFVTSYERLGNEGTAVVAELLEFLELEGGEERIADMLYRSSFRFLAGRAAGQEERGAFMRKGVSGDWKLHFSQQQKECFKQIAGDLLIELGYETGFDW